MNSAVFNAALAVEIGAFFAGALMQIIVLNSPAEYVPDHNPANQQILIYGD